MSDPRLERALIAAARRYAPTLVPPTWARAGDYPAPLPELAAALARHHVLVVLGALPEAQGPMAGVYYNDWASLYTGLYSRLAAALFPSYLDVSAYYADDAFPPIVLVHGEIMPVIDALARYAVPFVTAAQAAAAPPADNALLTVAGQMLDVLEAGDLARADYRRLQADLGQILRQLIDCQVRQQPLTPPAADLRLPAPLPAARPPAPPSLPEARVNAPAPPGLPELPAAPAPPTLPEDAPTFTPGAVPVFFDSRRLANAGAQRRPPVPDLLE